MFLSNSWYVIGWSHDVQVNGKPLGAVVIGQPIVVWRDQDGSLLAAENRCPHRHAPLSLGRNENGQLRCMYHGLLFNQDGRCVHMPLVESVPDVQLRMYPVHEQDDWIWLWTGAPEKADLSIIPKAWGISNPHKPMRSHSIIYDAHYQLIHDNLCDLSHVDFVHETTLRPATGAYWSESEPRVTPKQRSIRIARWFEDAEMPGNNQLTVDSLNEYEFSIPGVFVMYGARYPAGTAKQCDYQKPEGIKPLIENIEQQAVTPISETKTAYHYATGLIGDSPEMTEKLKDRMDTVMRAFQEDREMIEAQQQIWQLTDSATKKHFLIQDKGPYLMRKLLERHIRNETKLDT